MSCACGGQCKVNRNLPGDYTALANTPQQDYALLDSGAYPVTEETASACGCSQGLQGVQQAIAQNPLFWILGAFAVGYYLRDSKKGR